MSLSDACNRADFFVKTRFCDILRAFLRTSLVWAVLSFGKRFLSGTIEVIYRPIEQSWGRFRLPRHYAFPGISGGVQAMAKSAAPRSRRVTHDEGVFNKPPIELDIQNARRSLMSRANEYAPGARLIMDAILRRCPGRSCNETPNWLWLSHEAVPARVLRAGNSIGTMLGRKLKKSPGACRLGGSGFPLAQRTVLCVFEALLRFLSASIQLAGLGLNWAMSAL